MDDVLCPVCGGRPVVGIGSCPDGGTMMIPTPCQHCNGRASMSAHEAKIISVKRGVGDLVRRDRIKRGLTLGQEALRLGISVLKQSDIERGR